MRVPDLVDRDRQAHRTIRPHAGQPGRTRQRDLQTAESMIVEVGEQLPVLLEPFIQPGAVCGLEVVSRGFVPYDRVRTLEATHS